MLFQSYQQVTRWSVLAILTAASCRVAIGAEVAGDSFGYSVGSLQGAQGGAGWDAHDGWKTSHDPSRQYVCEHGLTYPLQNGESIGDGRAVAIHGISGRNNPLRRQLATAFAGDELLARFLLHYNASSIDNVGPHGDGEFFVLWLDDIDGGDGANHNPNVPSVGIHVPSDSSAENSKNRFMVRIGAENTAFSPVELEGDRTYLIVVRLSKTQSGPLAAYDRLELWVDPAPGAARRAPDAVAHGRSFNSIRWVGFSTGKKTEAEDFILIDELALGRTWVDVVPGAIAAPSAEEALPDSPESLAKVDFRRDVYPILREKCFSCHQGRDAESGHRLDVREEILGHYQGKPLAVPGDSKGSPLIEALVTDDEETRMPKWEDPLSEQEIATLRAWIDQGLVWDEKLLPSAPPESDHWSFQPVDRPEVPKVKESGVRGQESGNPIDGFVSAKHRELGLKFAPPADRRTLLRRITLDLTGLPPTLKEFEAFLSDDSPDALEKVIDRLLSSTAYGERWGRHWLDLARWAESDGHQQNTHRPEAWHYRDYVVKSFAANKPYDEFIRQQLAGDELEPLRNENLIATGFLAAARYSGNEYDSNIQRHDILVDVTNTTANALLGLTMQCAQCHSHKFDPVSARDYYRFLGFFIKGQPLNLALLDEQMGDDELQQVLAATDKQHAILYAAKSRAEANRRRQGASLAITQNAIIGSIPRDQRKEFDETKQLLSKFESVWAYYSPSTSPHRLGVSYVKRSSPLPYIPHMLQRAKPVLLYRGDLDSPGSEVDVGWPAVFGPIEGESKQLVDQRPRTALARWLTSRENPLTARVWINRVWLNHFGRGLVVTPDDFGTQGATPTHPELLDWLACELMENGWDTGHIHRLILTSRTYRQSSRFRETYAEIDPENQFYWRWNPRRLEAEAVRDSMLAVSGLLDPTIGGPSIPIKERDQSLRRTIYLEQRRGELPAVQQLFDSPSAVTCAGRRRTSTVPLQPLFLLNNPEVNRYAQAFADCVICDAGRDPTRRIERAYLTALGRLPDEWEIQRVLDYLEADSEGEDDSAQRFVQFCQGLLNLNEFLYIP